MEQVQVQVNRNFTEKLPCKLTDEELAHVAREIGAARRESQALDAERRQKADHYKARIEGVAAKVDELAERAATGTEEREIMCQELFVFPTNLVRVVRIDTGEVLRERAMTPDERQGSLFSSEAPTPAKAGTVITVPAEPGPTGQQTRLLSAGTDIDDPQKIIDGAEPKETGPKKRRKRKGSKR